MASVRKRPAWLSCLHGEATKCIFVMEMQQRRWRNTCCRRPCTQGRTSSVHFCGGFFSSQIHWPFVVFLGTWTQWVEKWLITVDSHSVLGGCGKRAELSPGHSEEQREKWDIHKRINVWALTMIQLNVASAESNNFLCFCYSAIKSPERSGSSCV